MATSCKAVVCSIDGGDCYCKLLPQAATKEAAAARLPGAARLQLSSSCQASHKAANQQLLPAW